MSNFALEESMPLFMFLFFIGLILLMFGSLCWMCTKKTKVLVRATAISTRRLPPDLAACSIAPQNISGIQPYGSLQNYPPSPPPYQQIEVQPSIFPYLNCERPPPYSLSVQNNQGSAVYIVPEPHCPQISSLPPSGGVTGTCHTGTQVTHQNGSIPLPPSDVIGTCNIGTTITHPNVPTFLPTGGVTDTSNIGTPVRDTHFSNPPPSGVPTDTSNMGTPVSNTRFFAP